MPLLEGLVKLVGWVIPLVVLAIIILPQAIRILREYERGVIFRLGKLLGAKGPGLIFLIPIVDRMVRMDLRVVTISVEKQEVMTRDNVPVTVDAVVYFRVVDPEAAVVKVENFLKAVRIKRLLGEGKSVEFGRGRDRIPPNHHYVDFAGVELGDLSEQEVDLLNRLTLFVTWAGRYHVARKSLPIDALNARKFYGRDRQQIHTLCQRLIERYDALS
jgi:hypothetical protein